MQTVVPVNLKLTTRTLWFLKLVTSLNKKEKFPAYRRRFYPWLEFNKAEIGCLICNMNEVRPCNKTPRKESMRPFQPIDTLANAIEVPQLQCEDETKGRKYIGQKLNTATLSYGSYLHEKGLSKMHQAIARTGC